MVALETHLHEVRRGSRHRRKGHGPVAFSMDAEREPQQHARGAVLLQTGRDTWELTHHQHVG